MYVERIRAPGLIQFAGLIAIATGVVLVVLLFYGGWVFAVPGALVVLYGVRRCRIAAIADDAGVVVRNQFRTHRVPWTAVIEMGFYERDVSTMQWSMRSRSSGFICTSENRRFWVDATEVTSIVMHGTAISDPGHRGSIDFERLRRRWKQATEAAPSR